MKTRISLAHLPPSVNHIYRRRKDGQVFKTQAYNTWANGEGYDLNRQMAGQKKWTGPVYLTLAMKRPRSNSDLDNRQKGIFDLLQAHGVIDNDKNIVGCNAFWTMDLPEGVSAQISIVSAEGWDLAA